MLERIENGVHLNVALMMNSLISTQLSQSISVCKNLPEVILPYLVRQYVMTSHS